MAKPGQSLQELVRAIERVTNPDPSITVESPKRLRDKDTGRLREHDVVMTITMPSRELIVAIECRDRSRKVDVNQVESFCKKCQCTNVNSGIIVSSRGFYSTAIKKAKAQNISCLSLSAAKSFDWCLALGMTVTEKQLIHTHVHIEVDGKISKNAIIYSDSGIVLDEKMCVKIGMQCMNSRDWSNHTEEPRDTMLAMRFTDESPAFYCVDGENKLPLKKIIVVCEYKLVDRFVPFSFHDYSDAVSGGQLCAVASADISVGAFQGRVMMTRGSDELITVSLVPGEQSSLVGKVLKVKTVEPS